MCCSCFTSSGAAIVMCKVCDTSIPNLRSIQCKNFHFICKSCIEEEVRQVMASEKVNFRSCLLWWESMPRIACTGVCECGLLVCDTFYMVVMRISLLL